MKNLWSANTPIKFWQCVPKISEEIWHEAYKKALPALGITSYEIDNIDKILSLTLGEGQFGENPWQMGQLKRIYYLIKQYLPGPITHIIKKVNAYHAKENFPLGWPIEDKFVNFQWEVIRNLLIVSGKNSIDFYHFWPEKKRFAFVVTHDIEMEAGQSFVREVADLEEDLGFRSSYNFVPERYPLDYQLIIELSDRGFEICVHGLKHDGKLFSSKERFLERATHINHYLKTLGAVGFRAPLMHRNPEWLQALDIEYDLSFFDTDPYEPIPGGCMTIWPFFVGKFVELPYTLVQDSTLGMVLAEQTPRLWLEKMDFIKQNFGMALINTHPDYLMDGKLMDIYREFLLDIKSKGDYWHALPNQVAKWWRKRSAFEENSDDTNYQLSTVTLEKDGIHIDL